MASALLSQIDDVLRAREPVRDVQAVARLRRLAATIAVFGFIYGAVMGSYGPSIGPRPLQIIYSGLKVPLLLVATFLVSLPSFYVVNSLLGLRRDFGRVLHALMATQAGLVIVLAALAPLTLMWYASTESYQGATLFNAAMFAVASFGGQALLRKYYQPLIRQDGRHRWMLWCWIFVFAFVGIQMGWILRPFIGNPREPVEFFRSDSWGNAYVVVWSLLRHALRWP